MVMVVDRDLQPDRWVLVQVDMRIPYDEGFTCVLAGWTGGYLDSDQWRRSTNIVARQLDGDYWVFSTESGSVYRCHRAGYGVTGLTGCILAEMQSLAERTGDTVTLLPDPSITL